jgi:hypothetical protein
MSRATSIAGVRPLGWPARVRAHSAVSWRAQRSCLADGAGAARLGPITALGNGARDGHARQRSGGQAKDMQTDTFARARFWRQAVGRPSAPWFDPIIRTDRNEVWYDPIIRMLCLWNPLSCKPAQSSFKQWTSSISIVYQ